MKLLCCVFLGGHIAGLVFLYLEEPFLAGLGFGLSVGMLLALVTIFVATVHQELGDMRKEGERG